MKFTLRSILSLLFASAVSLGAQADVAVPMPRPVTLADGTTLTVRLAGDEHGHYYLDDKNRMVLQAADGSFHLATEAERTSLMDYAAASRAKFSEWVMQRNVRYNRGELYTPTFTEAPTRAKMHIDGPVEYSGQNTGLVILVNYQDVKMTYTHEDFDRLCNATDYSRYGAIGSLKDYFYDQSYGKFEFDFDVVGPVTVSKNMAYYGENDPNRGNNDKNVGELIIEAITLADQQFGVDYTKYDWDGDGRVDQIYVIYAGRSESYDGNDPYTIWPHASGVMRGDGTYFTFDGVEVNSYACSGEIGGFAVRGDNYITGIGTMAHEFSHCFGLPDTYNTRDGGGITAMLYYDVMAGGAHSGPDIYQGTVPCGYTAYERWMCGWLDLIDLEEACHVADMPNLGDEPVAYRIKNDAHPDEYYLLENRNNKRWYSYFFDQPGVDGLLITHVDFDKDTWWINEVNVNNSAPRMGIVKAVNSGMYDNAVFGPKTVQEFSGISHNSANGKMYHNNEFGNRILNARVSNITLGADGKISFDFDKLSKTYQLGGEEYLDVVSFDFNAKANKRVKVRQTLDFVTTNTADLPLYDVVGSYYAPIPAGDINGFVPTMLYKGHGYDEAGDAYSWIMRVGTLNGETVMVDPLPVTVNGAGVIQSSHAFLPCNVNGGNISCVPVDFERGGSGNNVWSTTIGATRGSEATSLFFNTDEDGVLRVYNDLNVAYIKTSKIYGRTTITRPLELQNVTYIPLCIPTIDTPAAEYKLGTEVLLDIPAHTTVTTALSFIPQTKGLYQVEVRNMSGHVLTDAILAVGTTLPEGIKGIEVEDFPMGSTVKRVLPDGRIVIEKAGRTYELNGRIVK